MAEKLELDVVTPQRRVLQESVDMVTVPGLGGELGVLPGHTPLISRLQTGVLSYVADGHTTELLVSGGFVEVDHDRVSVLADVAERPEEIDLAKARQVKDQVEKKLNSWTEAAGEEFETARTELERSLVRIQLASGKPA